MVIGIVRHAELERHDRKGDRQAQEHEPISLMPKRTATAFSLRKPALSSLSRILPSSCLVGGTQRLTQLVRGRWYLGLELLLPASHPLFGLFAADRRVHDPAQAVLGASLGRSPSADRIAQTASVIARKTRKGSKASRVTGTVIHTLIATIFLIIQAPSSCKTPVIDQHLDADRCREQRTDIVIVREREEREQARRQGQEHDAREPALGGERLDVAQQLERWRINRPILSSTSARSPPVAR